MLKTFVEASGQVWNCEIVDQPRCAPKGLTIRFYDGDYAGKGSFGPHGQFVSEYYVKTLLGQDEWSRPAAPGTGLCLHGGEPKWTVSGAVMDQVRAWLRAL